MKLPRIPRRQSPAFAASIFDRALFDGLACRQFGPEQVKKALHFFCAPPLRCVYCGTDEVSRWDHLVALRRGGETVLGNLVPACGPCDDSKAQRDFDLWMRSNAKRSPTTREISDVEIRITRLREYAAHFGYVPTPLIKRLTPDQFHQLEELRGRLEQLRRDAEALIASCLPGRVPNPAAAPVTLRAPVSG
jgi:HNH endonuclease